MTKSEQLLIGLSLDEKIVLRNGHVTISGYGGDEDIPYEKRDYIVEAYERIFVLPHNGVVEIIKHHGLKNWIIAQ
ncbi:MAG: hypothetical protein QJR05_04540 [Thermoanaerobacterium sp.]|nr:hypothetical protein [Thermoanaerobacterium sp.]